MSHNLDHEPRTKGHKINLSLKRFNLSYSEIKKVNPLESITKRKSCTCINVHCRCNLSVHKIFSSIKSQKPSNTSSTTKY